MKKNWTGERLETFILNGTTVEHLHRYALALEYVSGKEVLDIACGEGYGTNLLAQQAAFVTGVDISENTIAEAKQKYKKENLLFKQGKAELIPLSDNSVDIVISYETIEHHDKHEDMIIEIKRVLRKDGILIISSPDKKYYSDIPNFRNPFHVKELYAEEFATLIQKYFHNTQFISQRLFSGSIFFSESEYRLGNMYTGDFSAIKNQGDIHGIYNICIASNSTLESSNLSLFDGWKLLNTPQSDTSMSYKVGNFILFPLKFLNRMIRKSKNL